jgi:hypothetical protein
VLVRALPPSVTPSPSGPVDGRPGVLEEGAEPVVDERRLQVVLLAEGRDETLSSSSRRRTWTCSAVPWVRRSPLLRSAAEVSWPFVEVSLVGASALASVPAQESRSSRTGTGLGKPKRSPDGV